MPTVQLSQLAGVIPVLEETAAHALEAARASLQETRARIASIQLQHAALQYSKSPVPSTRAFGKLARDFLKQENTIDARLAMAMAEMHLQLSEAGAVSRKSEWVHSFLVFSNDFSAQMKKGPLAEAVRTDAYAMIIATDQHVSIAVRERTLHLLQRSKNAFIRQSASGIAALYTMGATNTADVALIYLQYYRDMRKEGLQRSDGTADTEKAIRETLDTSNPANNLFQTAMEKYMRALLCNEAAAQLRQAYAVFQKIFGGDAALEKKLAGVSKLLDSRNLEKAQQQIPLFLAALQHAFDAKQKVALGELQSDLQSMPAALAELEKHFQAYVQPFPKETKVLIARMEKLEQSVQVLLPALRSAAEKKPSVAEAKALEANIQSFYTGRAALFSLLSTAETVMNASIAEQQFADFMQAAGIGGVPKKYALQHGARAEKHLQKALAALLKDAADSSSARKSYAAAMEEKTKILAMLRLRTEKMETVGKRLFDPTKKPSTEFAFFKDASLRVYDAAVEGNPEIAVRTQGSVLFTLEQSIRQSEKGLLTPGRLRDKDVRLQDSIVADTQRLLHHYEGKAVFSSAEARALEKAVRKNAESLATRIRVGQYAGQAVELAGALVHPSVFFSTAVKMVAADISLKGRVSWPSIGMTAASLLAFRHSIPAFNTRLVAAAEMAVAVPLMGHGGVEMYRAFKEERWADAVFTAAMFTVPMAYATIRGRVVGAAPRHMEAHRRTAARILEEMAETAETKAAKRQIPEGLRIRRVRPEELLPETKAEIQPPVPTSVQLQKPIRLMDFVRRWRDVEAAVKGLPPDALIKIEPLRGDRPPVEVAVKDLPRIRQSLSEYSGADIAPIDQLLSIYTSNQNRFADFAEFAEFLVRTKAEPRLVELFLTPEFSDTMNAMRMKLDTSPSHPVVKLQGTADVYSIPVEGGKRAVVKFAPTERDAAILSVAEAVGLPSYKIHSHDYFSILEFVEGQTMEAALDTGVIVDSVTGKISDINNFNVEYSNQLGRWMAFHHLLDIPDPHTRNFLVRLENDTFTLQRIDLEGRDISPRLETLAAKDYDRGWLELGVGEKGFKDMWSILLSNRKKILERIRSEKGFRPEDLSIVSERLKRNPEEAWAQYDRQ